MALRQLAFLSLYIRDRLVLLIRRHARSVLLQDNGLPLLPHMASDTANPWLILTAQMVRNRGPGLEINRESTLVPTLSELNAQCNKVLEEFLPLQR